MQHIVDMILAAVAIHGYIVLALVVAGESSGVPLPGEAVLLLAAFLARQGHLDIRLVILVAAVAAIVGDNIGYAIGRAGGRRVVDRYGRFILLTPARIARCEGFFHRHGGKAVFLARWSAGLRVAGAWVAGMSRMAWPRFLLWNALGGIMWAVAVGVAGYALGASYQAAGRYISSIGLVIVVGVLLSIAFRLRGQLARLGQGVAMRVWHLVRSAALGCYSWSGILARTVRRAPSSRSR